MIYKKENLEQKKQRVDHFFHHKVLFKNSCRFYFYPSPSYPLIGGRKGTEIYDPTFRRLMAEYLWPWREMVTHEIITKYITNKITEYTENNIFIQTTTIH